MQLESDKLTVDTTNESQEASPPPPPPSRGPQNTHKQTQQTQNRTKTQKIHKRSTAPERPAKHPTGGPKQAQRRQRLTETLVSLGANYSPFPLDVWGSSVVRHLPLVLEVPGLIPACGEENFGVRTRFLWCHFQG